MTYSVNCEWRRLLLVYSLCPTRTRMQISFCLLSTSCAQRNIKPFCPVYSKPFGIFLSVFSLSLSLFVCMCVYVCVCVCLRVCGYVNGVQPLLHQCKHVYFIMYMCSVCTQHIQERQECIFMY